MIFFETIYILMKKPVSQTWSLTLTLPTWIVLNLKSTPIVVIWVSMVVIKKKFFKICLLVTGCNGYKHFLPLKCCSAKRWSSDVLPTPKFINNFKKGVFFKVKHKKASGTKYVF